MYVCVYVCIYICFLYEIVSLLSWEKECIIIPSGRLKGQSNSGIKCIKWINVPWLLIKMYLSDTLLLDMRFIVFNYCVPLIRGVQNWCLTQIRHMLDTKKQELFISYLNHEGHGQPLKTHLCLLIPESQSNILQSHKRWASILQLSLCGVNLLKTIQK